MPEERGTPSEGGERYRAHLAHRSRRRLRLRIEADRLEPGAARDLADRLASVHGVARAVVRPNTRSLILDTHIEAGEVLAELGRSSVIGISAPPKPPPVGQMIQLGLLKADMGLGRRTDDALDLRTALALLLLVAAVLQLGRGRIAGPATTLAMSAFALLDKPATGGRR